VKPRRNLSLRLLGVTGALAGTIASSASTAAASQTPTQPTFGTGNLRIPAGLSPEEARAAIAGVQHLVAQKQYARAMKELRDSVADAPALTAVPASEVAMTIAFQWLSPNAYSDEPDSQLNASVAMQAKQWALLAVKMGHVHQGYVQAVTAQDALAQWEFANSRPEQGKRLVAEALASANKLFNPATFKDAPSHLPTYENYLEAAQLKLKVLLGATKYDPTYGPQAARFAHQVARTLGPSFSRLVPGDGSKIQKTFDHFADRVDGYAEFRRTEAGLNTNFDRYLQLQDATALEAPSDNLNALIAHVRYSCELKQPVPQQHLMSIKGLSYGFFALLGDQTASTDIDNVLANVASTNQNSSDLSTYARELLDEAAPEVPGTQGSFQVARVSLKNAPNAARAVQELKCAAQKSGSPPDYVAWSEALQKLGTRAFEDGNNEVGFAMFKQAKTVLDRTNPRSKSEVKDPTATYYLSNLGRYYLTFLQSIPTEQTRINAVTAWSRYVSSIRPNGEIRPSDRETLENIGNYGIALERGDIALRTGFSQYEEGLQRTPPRNSLPSVIAIRMCPDLV
jgi:hypothetical protein